MPLIEFRNVSKTFSRGGGGRLLRTYLGLFSQRPGHENFYALKDVSFTVEHGESVAIIGSNGAGKSTLLSLVAGLTPPDGGTVEVNGRVAALGDQAFQAKCMEKIREFRRQGKTPLCVSHSAEMVRAFCDRAIWLEHGTARRTGSAGEVLAAYQRGERG